jgi:hypothetical protein
MKIEFIDGYLQALSDLNAGLTMRIFLDNTCANAEVFLKKHFPYSQDYRTIKEVSCKKCLCNFSLLKEMVAIDSFSSNTKGYILDHLSDYIDFVFDENKCKSISSDNTVSLLDRLSSMAIVSFIKNDDCQIVLCVFSSNNEHQLDKRFEKILDICTTQKKVSNENTPFENGLSKEENERIIKPIIQRSLETKSLSKEEKKILVKYIGKDRTEAFIRFVSSDIESFI